MQDDYWDEPPKSLETKSFTVREVVKAIAVDGFDHLRGEWFKTFDGKLTGGCVLAQGAINLSVLPEKDDFGIDINLDFVHGTLVDQLNRFPNKHPRWSTPDAKWGMPADDTWFKECGSAIIHWNDAERWKKNTDGSEMVEDGPEYYLPTYKEVADMAAEILAPYLDETIELSVVDYGEWLPAKVSK